MTATYVSTIQNFGVGLGPSDVLVITATGAHLNSTALGQAVEFGFSSGTLIVAGMAAATSTAVEAAVNTTGNRITVTDSGIIAGGGIGVRANAGTDLRIVNAGSISGGSVGIESTGAVLVVANTGTLSGGIGVDFLGGAYNLSNSGDILGTSTQALLLTATSGGTIHGVTVGIFADGAGPV